VERVARLREQSVGVVLRATPAGAVLNQRVFSTTVPSHSSLFYYKNRQWRSSLLFQLLSVLGMSHVKETIGRAHFLPSTRRQEESCPVEEGRGECRSPISEEPIAGMPFGSAAC
jgi:hypothetical protein